jgi:hypothetical protein
MSAKGAIPPSITDALNSPTGYVLMINGKPGTGKNLFVQELFMMYKNSFLILSDAETTELFALDTLENKFGVADVKGMLAEITDALPITNKATITILNKHQELNSGSIAHGIHLRVKELWCVKRVWRDSTDKLPCRTTIAVKRIH